MHDSDRWIVASKMIPVFDNELLTKIANLGGSVGGGWCEVHQHVHVMPENKEAIEELLVRNGYKVLPPGGFPAARPASGRFHAVRRDDPPR